MKQPFLYVRALRHAEHTVFCVQEGQKSYYNTQFNQYIPYSSGQQVKRSALDSVLAVLGKQQAPTTFNYTLDRQDKLGNGEPWSPCDPSYIDQLLGGWMKATTGEITLKRRSPLSISAMRPLHPLLSSMTKENATFDRSSNPDIHPVRVRRADGSILTDEEIEEYLTKSNATLGRRNWVPNLSRADGLFVYDIAIDMRTLFSVSLNQHEPEINKDTIEKLVSLGWKETKNDFGSCLVAPKEERDKIIPALAHGLINWRITSNQARTFSLMETLAVAISDNANKLAGSIRAKLSEDTEKQRAIPLLDDTAGANIYIALPCDGYIVGASGTANALEDAEKYIIEQLQSYDYENQK
jgi:hypothetical protein